MVAASRNQGIIGADFDLPTTDAEFGLGDMTYRRQGIMLVLRPGGRRRYHRRRLRRSH